MSFKLFTVICRHGDQSQIPKMWHNFVHFCEESVPTWDDMTMREAGRTIDKLLEAQNAWVVDDEMDKNGIVAVAWSLWFKTEEDATTFTRRWS